MNTALASPIGQIYTMDGAAEVLHISRKKLQELIQDHPYYSTNGVKKLFSDDDILQLWEAMRCHSNSKSGTASGISAARSGASAFTNLQKLATENSQRRSGRLERRK